MNSSVTYGRTPFYYENIDDFSTSADPTNFDVQNGRESNGTSGANSPRWTAKLSGMYALPWHMSAAAFYNMREGTQFNRTILSPNRTGSLGTVSVSVEPQGTRHYPAYRQLDVHVDKGLPFGRRRILVNVDVFNALNAATVLARTTRQNASNANYVTTILAPRVARVGVRINF